MKVVYTELDNSIFIAAKHIASSSHDDCFSIHDLATELNLSYQTIRETLDSLYDWGFCMRMNEAWSDVATINERWVLIQIPFIVGKTYEVLCIEGTDYRLLTDSEVAPYGNDPVLFSHHCFQIIDSTEPPSWVCERDEAGERYCSPPEWRGSFFEQYHDGTREAQEQFWKILQRDYPETAQAFWDSKI